MEENKVLINNYENLLDYKKSTLNRITEMEELRENNINHSDTFIDLSRIETILFVLYDELHDIEDKLHIFKWLRMTKISIIREVFDELAIDPLPDEKDPKMSADYIFCRLQNTYDVTVKDMFDRINKYEPY